MAEENQVQQEPQMQQEPQQVQRVATKNPKKVEVGKRLAAHNHRKREELKAKKREELKAQVQKGELTKYYGIGVVLAVGVIGGLGYYIYGTKKGEVNTIPNNPPHHPTWQPPHRHPQSNKFEMD